jgi:nucleotide-binding universal stress UspA family protein
MTAFGHPRVVVGVDTSLTGLAALRAAVAEARRRAVPLHAVRALSIGRPTADNKIVAEAFALALGGVPGDIEVHTDVVPLTVLGSLLDSATDRRDLVVVGSSGRGSWHAFWSGSAARTLMRHAPCPVMAVPAPEMSRAVRPPHRWTGRMRWDPWQEFEQQPAEPRGLASSGG